MRRVPQLPNDGTAFQKIDEFYYLDCIITRGRKLVKIFRDVDIPVKILTNYMV